MKERVFSCHGRVSLGGRAQKKGGQCYRNRGGGAGGGKEQGGEGRDGVLVRTCPWDLCRHQGRLRL